MIIVNEFAHSSSNCSSPGSLDLKSGISEVSIGDAAPEVSIEEGDSGCNRDSGRLQNGDTIPWSVYTWQKQQ